MFRLLNSIRIDIDKHPLLWALIISAVLFLLWPLTEWDSAWQEWADSINH